MDIDPSYYKPNHITYNAQRTSLLAVIIPVNLSVTDAFKTYNLVVAIFTMRLTSLY